MVSILNQRFTLYKLPKETKSVDEANQVENPFLSQGTAYTYSTNKDPFWKLSNLSFNVKFVLSDIFNISVVNRPAGPIWAYYIKIIILK